MQNQAMTKKVTDLEQLLATYAHSRDNSFLFQREQQLHLEQQQLYKLTQIFDVSYIKNQKMPPIK